ncbi:MAG: hemerythrin domain-containing protein, partial [Microthrixaceae bacterium]
MQSWFDIHEALRNTVAELAQRATDADFGDPGQVARFTDDVSFFMDVLAVHSKGEDGIVFPMLRDWEIEVPEGLTTEHHEELLTIYDVHTAAIELRFATDGHDTVPAVELIRRGLN